MKGIVLCLMFVTLFLVAGGCHRGTDGKQGLKVLYVGFNPDRELPPRTFAHGAGIAESRYEKDMRERLPAFEKLLKQYFVKVQTVDAQDYEESMTEEFDVIVFDGLPEPVYPKQEETETELAPVAKKLADVVDTKALFAAHYFSDQYSKPTLFVGDKAGILGAALGLKLNWYCRCLDAHAYDIRVDHPIFQGPLPVDMKYERRIAPSSAISGVEGVTTPGVMDMWRVQTEGYREGGRERYRQGLVAFGDGFEENGDGERIAGGVSDKYRNAVAIGRHGNFFMWGFAADPNYMTETAQRVFINAICYISKFDGKVPVTRKYENGYVTREKLRQQLALFERDTFEHYRVSRKAYNEKLMELKREVEDLNAAGKEVPGDLMGQAWPQPQKVMEYEEYLNSYLKRDRERAGCSDAEEYRVYLKKNMDYFYGGTGNFSFRVDRDLKQLGIAVGDVKGLERAIELLEGSPEEREKGERLLARYSTENFSTVAEWKTWLDEVRDRLIFSEACGYKFVDKVKGMAINRIDKTQGGVQQDNPVSVLAMRIGKEIQVQFTMKEGFHIYANSGEEGAYVLTDVKFEYPRGIEPDGKLKVPEGKAYEADPKVKIYEKKVTLVQPVKVIPADNKGVIICTVTYQACDDMICMPPVTEEIEVMNL